MWHRRTALTALVATAWSPNEAVAHPPVKYHWVASNLPPYAWQSRGQGRGFAHDLVMAMDRLKGLAPQVTFVPWARAIQMVRHGAAFGTFPLTRSPEREEHFHWLASLGSADQCLFVQSALSHAVTAESLRQQRVAVLRGSPLVPVLRGDGFVNLVECQDFKELLRMWVEGMVSGAAASRPMFLSAMRELGLDPKQAAVLRVIGKSELYIAVAKSVPTAELAGWRAAYQQLEADGTVARLRKLYLDDLLKD